jgi:8-oxo-dGTP pyrophosphatase MutT (NUDIX family)
MSPAPHDPIPAATLVLMRAGDEAPELLMVERGARMAFAPGALVFPGGRIDADDRALGRDPLTAAKVAAIRETLEETGIAVAIEPVPPAALEAALRRALHAGESFPALLAEHGLSLRPDDLLPFARWCPTFRETRNFDTHFFLARAPAESRLPTPDNGESVHASWTTAAAVLARADAGDAHIIFPTRRNLERLARFGSFEEAARDAAAHPVEKIVPWIEDRGGAQWLCIPEGRGYPVTAEPLSSARRG